MGQIRVNGGKFLFEFPQAPAFFFRRSLHQAAAMPRSGRPYSAPADTGSVCRKQKTIKRLPHRNPSYAPLPAIRVRCPSGFDECEGHGLPSDNGVEGFLTNSKASRLLSCMFAGTWSQWPRWTVPVSSPPLIPGDGRGRRGNVRPGTIRSSGASKVEALTYRVPARWWRDERAGRIFADSGRPVFYDQPEGSDRMEDVDGSVVTGCDRGQG